MKVYKALCSVGHIGAGNYKFAPVYVKAKSISDAQSKISNIPAVGNYKGEKRAKSVELLAGYNENSFDGFFKYSREFKDLVDFESHYEEN